MEEMTISEGISLVFCILLVGTVVVCCVIILSWVAGWVEKKFKELKNFLKNKMTACLTKLMDRL